jgi:hypothetical protein
MLGASLQTAATELRRHPSFLRGAAELWLHARNYLCRLDVRLHDRTRRPMCKWLTGRRCSRARGLTVAIAISSTP